MMGCLAALAVLWLALIMIGLIVKTLLWATGVGLVMLVVTGLCMAAEAYIHKRDHEANT